MENHKMHFWHTVLFFFRKGVKATDAWREICGIYGDLAISADTCQRWFERFRSGDVNLSDAACSGRPSIADDDQILAAIKVDRHLTTREIVKHFNIVHTTVAQRLKRLGLTKKADVWVLHKLTEKNVLDRIMVCESLLKWNLLEPFLKRVVTGDEKWVVYNNIRRQKSWCGPGESSQSVAEADLHPKKVMLNIWWDWRGVLYFELLPCGQTIDGKKYCAQLDKLKQAIAKKRPELANRKGVVFHHDNARPHTALVTKQKMKSFG
ncbi:histone-lysine N-methyltransferase SETMAR-like [Linepithema humile]|uniref:histone-lysine N-methyltransferase SETMAR-like n=1 Tax=Linepithema humile TaxID=83485 RepID=UPI00351E92E8